MTLLKVSHIFKIFVVINNFSIILFIESFNFFMKMKFKIDRERKWESTLGERERSREERETTWYYVKRRIWNKNIDFIDFTSSALQLTRMDHSELGVFQCVSYWLCFNHFIVITARALIFCLWSDKWKLIKKFSLILYFWGIIYFFIHYQIFLSSKRKKARFSSIVWGNSLFTNIRDQDWIAVSNAVNEVLCVGKQWIYHNLIYLHWNILLPDFANEWIHQSWIYSGFKTSHFESL